MTTKVKEKPILFSGPMVRAILEGRKTQTRLVVNPQPPDGFRPVASDCDCNGNWWFSNMPKQNGMFSTGEFSKWDHVYPKCPYPPGMRLWVRETFAFAEDESGAKLVVYRSDGAIADVYQLDDGSPSLNGFRSERWDESRHGKLRWKPSIFMPRWASRLEPIMTTVRVERLQDINTEDAFADGVEVGDCVKAWECSSETWPGVGAYPDELSNAAGGRPWAECHCVIDKFRGLWDSTKAKHPWASNPWVWVVEFRRD